jgi:hypothetical protein
VTTITEVFRDQYIPSLEVLTELSYLFGGLEWVKIILDRRDNIIVKSPSRSWKMHTLPLCSQTLFESIILRIMMSVTLFEETLLVLFSMSTTISSGTYMQSKTKLVRG